MNHLLTINAGSSSIKFALFAADSDLTHPVEAGQIEGLGSSPGAMAHEQALDSALSHEQALDSVLVRIGTRRVVAVGHRIVHGGTTFVQPALIDAAVLSAITALEPMAPLHQPHNVAGVRAAQRRFPGVPQVACFDTAFHRSMPDLNQRFALPQRWHDAGVRRYGFHGLSYESIRSQLRAIDATAADGRIVVAHLGNGASMCAMRHGRSVATTMSFSPLDGLPMGTRCGRLDAAVVLHLLQHEGLDADQIGQLLYRQSGLLGLSGESSDWRTLQASAKPAAAMAIDYFIEQVLQELAAMVAALRGIDMLVFTGGIGENAVALRARVVEGSAWLGLKLDAKANGAAKAAGAATVNAAGEAVVIRVMRTNEEAVIAQQTAMLLGCELGREPVN